MHGASAQYQRQGNRSQGAEFAFCITTPRLHRISGECTIGGMRTTVTLSDEAAELVNQYAESARVSRSRAVSDLILRSSRTKPRFKLVNGIAVFDIPGGRRVTTEDVKRFEDEEF